MRADLFKPSFFVLLLAAFVCACSSNRTQSSAFPWHEYEKVAQELTVSGQTEEDSNAEVCAVPGRVITLTFAGDTTMGDYPEQQGMTFNWQYKQLKGDKKYFLKNMLPMFTTDDFTIVNLEGAITDNDEAQEKEFRFKGPYEYLDILKAGSVEMVNMANNHTHDYGVKGYNDTRENLKKAGIAFFGYDDLIVKELHETKLCFHGLKGFDWNRDSKMLLKHLKHFKEINCDIIITTFHWGEEKAYENNALQERLARLAVDNGSSLIIGHHAHVVQNIAQYKGVTIVYSLGNFVFGGNKNPADKRALLYRVKIQDGKIISANPVKILISSEKARNNYQPVFDGEYQDLL
ncbi:Putative protein of poly-gamma-glutamate biosynthesis [Elusimicrobium minutum Pei191]|uniref:Capsule synthesis protein CapA domain-containing protein n=1 Tax=Elusimicrobium minutum (strain Pei191) TaxID=445932 RepID=B2KBX9_ELUMP|nr:CapA family protein [Elusimicrobium minutum]ACC97883.1 Putative protein of poly-gamma-glutamate biosynthesis [Elusimicrobium minutum Pei191]